MIVCNRCGKENQDHYKFCLGCGAELTTPGKPAGDVAMMKTMMADASQLAGASAGAMPPRPSGPTPMVPGVPPGLGAPPGLPMGPPGLGAMPPGMGPPPGLGGGPLPPLGPPPGLGGSPLPPLGPPPGLGGFSPGLGGMPPGPLGTSPTAPPGPAPLGAPPSAGPPAGPPPGVPVGMAGMPGPGMPGGGGPMGAPGFPMGAPTNQGPAAQPAGGARRCPSCSNEVPPNFRFCGACGFRMDDASGPSAMPGSGGVPRATANQFAEVRAQPRSTLTLIRPDGTEGGVHELKTGENKIGRSLGAVFENDGYLSPTHAELVVNAAGAVVRDLDSLNGVFVKMTDEEEIQSGQVLRIGQELLRFDLINPPEPAADGTEVMGSPNPGFWGKVTVIVGREVDGSAYPLLGENVTMGRERGEINFPDDGYVSGLHAKIVTRDGRVYLSDLGSSNGTFIKVQGERSLRNESFVLLGQQLFRLNLAV